MSFFCIHTAAVIQSSCGFGVVIKLLWVGCSVFIVKSLSGCRLVVGQCSVSRQNYTALHAKKLLSLVMIWNLQVCIPIQGSVMIYEFRDEAVLA